MLKYILLSINLLAGIIYFFTGSVFLSLEAPETVTSGNDFTVTVTIHKSDLTNYARFKQQLPLGLKGSEGESKNGMFSFKDQDVKIMWMIGTLPKEEEFKIYYTISTDPTFSGPVELGGQINYVDEEGQRQEIFADPITVMVVGDGEIPVDTVLTHVNPIDTAKVVKYDESKFIRRLRYEGNSIIVEVDIYKGSNNGFGKVVENVPDGYTASVIDSHDGIFKDEGGVLKFMWNALPAEDVFTISYKLTPESSDVDLWKIIDGINGEFSTIDENGNPISVKVNNSGDSQDKLKDDFKTAGIDPKIVAQKDPKTNDGNNGTSTWKPNNGDTQSSYVAKPEPGIRYKVQVCALQKYKNPYFVKRKRKITNVNEDIYVETHMGWHKYTVGSFPIYKLARDYRLKIWDKTEASDAFVAAYNDGIRITIQEALMVSNNSWYQ